MAVRSYSSKQVSQGSSLSKLQAAVKDSLAGRRTRIAVNRAHVFFESEIQKCRGSPEKFEQVIDFIAEQIRKEQIKFNTKNNPVFMARKDEVLRRASNALKQSGKYSYGQILQDMLGKKWKITQVQVHSAILSLRREGKLPYSDGKPLKTAASSKMKKLSEQELNQLKRLMDLNARGRLLARDIVTFSLYHNKKYDFSLSAIGRNPFFSMAPISISRIIKKVFKLLH